MHEGDSLGGPSHLPNLPDYNKVLAQVVNQQVERALKAAPNAIRQLRVNTGAILSSYLTNIGERMYNMKTLIYDDVPVPISQLYVPLDFSTKQHKIENATLSDILSVSKNIIITGAAGSGKSTAFRHFFLESLAYSTAAPLFLALRDANSSDHNLIELLATAVSRNSSETILVRDLATLAENGLVMLFLDGLDEVLEEKRDTIRSNILDFAEKFPNVQIVVSSRPTEHSAWEAFTCLELQELTLEQATGLTQKLDFDESNKAKFVELLKESLYASHRSFASNPLLLNLMVLMYSRNAEIPKKWHLFYEQAFELLFHRHDAKKPGGYNRVYKTGLAIDDFEKQLASLSLICFQKGILSFTSTELRGLINQSNAISEVKVEAAKFVDDLENQVCLIILDGLEYRFTHKTFIEFFAAKYVSRVDSIPLQEEIIQVLGDRVKERAFLATLHAERPLLAERAIIIPRMKLGLDQLRVASFATEEAYENFLELAQPTIRLSGSSLSYGVKSNLVNDIFELVRCLDVDLYPPSMSEVDSLELQKQVAKHADEFDGTFQLRSHRESYPELFDLAQKHWWVGRTGLLFLQQVLERFESTPNSISTSIADVILGAKGGA